MADTREIAIVNGLLTKPAFVAKVAQHIKPDVFPDELKALVYSAIHFFKRYVMLPTQQELILHIPTACTGTKYARYSENSIDELLAGDFYEDKPVNIDWLFDLTETYTRDREIYKQIVDAIEVYQDTTRQSEISAIPTALAKAIAITFNPDIGVASSMSVTDRNSRYEKMIGEPLKCGIHEIDARTELGQQRGNLHIINAGINVGKTLAMVSIACGYLRKGNNVAYVMFEESEQAILSRFDSNMFAKPAKKLTDDEMDKCIADVYGSAETGTVYIRRFTQATGSSDSIGAWMDAIEQEVGNGFKFDALFVDYIEDASPNVESFRMQNYEKLQQIAVELCDLGYRRRVVLWTAQQLNREGMNTKQAGLGFSGSSLGPSKKASLVIGLIAEEDNKYTATIEKTRYDIGSLPREFQLGVNKQTQTLIGSTAIAFGGGATLVANTGIKTEKPVFTKPEQTAEPASQQPPKFVVPAKKQDMSSFSKLKV